MNWVSLVTADGKTLSCDFSPLMQVYKSEQLFRGLAVHIDMESWENTESDVRDEHQECEIDFNTAGRAEKGDRGRVNGWRDT